MFSLFLLFWLGQSLTGLHRYNEERREHGQPEVGYGQYLRSGEFLEVTFENWESEVLQMGAFVVLASFLKPVHLPAPEGLARVEARPRPPP